MSQIYIKEEEVWTEPMVEGVSNEFQVFNFDFMPMGTYLKGGHMQDMPRGEETLKKAQDFPLLPKGLLGLQFLQSSTRQNEIEEGEIPLPLEREPKLPPPLVIEEEIPILLILVI